MRRALLQSASLLLVCACHPHAAQPAAPRPPSSAAATLANTPVVWLEAEHFDEASEELSAAPVRASKEGDQVPGFEGVPLTTQRDTDGLEISDYALGEGPEAHAGAHLSLHYTGTLLDGTPFDSSYERALPFEFELGAGRVIEGFERGLEGVRAGMLRKLVIPPELAYGDRARAKIPAHATLVFHIEVLEVN